MRTVAIHEAEASFSKLLEEAESGEEVVISRDGEPVVRLVPMRPAPKTRPFGLYRNEAFELGPEFFEPLPDDELEAWEQ